MSVLDLDELEARHLTDAGSNVRMVNLPIGQLRDLISEVRAVRSRELHGEDRDIAGLHAAADAECERDEVALLRKQLSDACDTIRNLVSQKQCAHCLASLRAKEAT